MHGGGPTVHGTMHDLAPKPLYPSNLGGTKSRGTRLEMGEKMMESAGKLEEALVASRIDFGNGLLHNEPSNPMPMKFLLDRFAGARCGLGRVSATRVGAGAHFCSREEGGVMQNVTKKGLMLAGLLFLGGNLVGCVFGPIKITKPVQTSTVTSPVEVCMDVTGYVVEPAKNGVNPGTGHHHLLVDVPLPEDLSKPINKDSNHIHMGDGSSCKILNLEPGWHTIQTLFANGNHIPYNPPITTSIAVQVK